MTNRQALVAGLITCMIAAVFALSPLVLSAATEKSGDEAPGRTMAKQAVKREKRWITSDHTKHEVLKQEFNSGEEVTKACLSCHSEASAQFHKTTNPQLIDPDFCTMRHSVIYIITNTHHHSFH